MLPTLSYRGIPGWFDFADYYAEIAQRMPENAKLVEVGAFLGASSACLRDSFITAGKDFASLDIIDTWSESVRNVAEAAECLKPFKTFRDGFDHYMKKVALYYDERCRVMQNDSLEFADIMRDYKGLYDFVFLDGDHTNPHLTNEIRAFLPLIKPGGVIAGHDWTTAHPGIDEALRTVWPEGGYVKKSRACWEYQL